MHRSAVRGGLAGIIMAAACTALPAPAPQAAQEREIAGGIAGSGMMSGGIDRQADDCPRGARPGEILWTFAVPGARDSVTEIPAVADDGTVYLVTSEGLLYAVDCRGIERWRFDTGEHVQAGLDVNRIIDPPAIGGDGTIYLVSSHRVTGRLPSVDMVWAIRPDGELIWRYGKDDQAQHPILFGSLVIDTSGHVMFGGRAFHDDVHEGLITALARDGQPLPGFPIASRPIFHGSAGLADGRVVFVSDAVPEFVATATRVRSPTPTPTARPATPTLLAPSPSPTRRATATITPLPVHLAHLPWAGTQHLGEARANWRSGLGRLRERDAAEPRDRRGGPSGVTAHSRAELRVIANAEAPGASFDHGERVFVSPLVAAGDMIVTQVITVVGATVEGPPRIEGWSLRSNPPSLLWHHQPRTGAIDTALIGDLDPLRGTAELIYLDSSGLIVSLAVPTDPDAMRPPTFNWVRDLGSNALRGPVLGDGGYVYAEVDGDTIVAVDRDDGSDGWSLDLGGERVVAALTLAPGGVLYAGTSEGAGSGKLYAIATESRGLDPDAAWPALRGDRRNTGRARR
jgi:outer membrane protein assembly factor BamB